MSGENIKIAYLHVQFPKLSETFVWREVEALEGLGIDIKNISLKRSFHFDCSLHATRRGTCGSGYASRLSSGERCIWRG